jgi:hypothetical protein
LIRYDQRQKHLDLEFRRRNLRDNPMEEEIGEDAGVIFAFGWSLCSMSKRELVFNRN